MKTLLYILSSFVLISCAEHKIDVKTFEVTPSATTVEESTEVRTLLRNAIVDEDLEKLEQLCQQIDINHFKMDDKSILEFAIELEKIKAIRKLRKIGADNQLINLGFSSLEEWAASLPAEKGSLVRAVMVDFSQEARELWDVLKTNNFKNIKALLDQGVDLNIHFEEGETPLTLSIKEKLMMSLRALFMNSELNVNLPNQQGIFPLRLAEELKLDPIIAELKKRGAQNE